MPNGTSGGVGGSEVQTRSLPDCLHFPVGENDEEE